MRNEGKEPLYTSDDVKEMVKHTICLEYDEVSDITPDIRITLYNAGHILGSSMVHMHVGNGLHNILYTADLKYGKTMLLEPAVTKFPRLETLMMESTYGAKNKIRILDALKFSGLISVAYMVMGLIVFQLFSGPFLDMFNSNENMKQIYIRNLHLLLLKMVLQHQSTIVVSVVVLE